MFGSGSFNCHRCDVEAPEKERACSGRKAFIEHASSLPKTALLCKCKKALFLAPSISFLCFKQPHFCCLASELSCKGEQIFPRKQRKAAAQLTFQGTLPPGGSLHATPPAPSPGPRPLGLCCRWPPAPMALDCCKPPCLLGRS